MKKNKNTKGITLIALVITIIILLILVGITIATLTGENGILSKANTASEESKKKEYEEVLKVIGNGLKSDKILEQLKIKEFMDRYQEKIKENEKFKDAKEIKRKTDKIIIILTKEEYVFMVTEDKIECSDEKWEEINKVPPKYLIRESKLLVPQTGFSGSGDGCAVQQWEPSVSIILYSSAEYASFVYWKIEPEERGNKVYARLDAPSISLDSYTQDARWIFFCC